MGTTTTQCRSCGADIVWAKTESGARMPLNASPTRGFQLQEGRFVEAGQAPILGPLTTVYVSHFATCPNAAEHRRK